MAELIDGKKISQNLKDEVKAQVSELKEKGSIGYISEGEYTIEQPDIRSVVSIRRRYSFAGAFIRRSLR